MKKFNNKQNANRAKKCDNWDYAGHFQDDVKAARKRASELHMNGANAFYKKIREKGKTNYHVFISRCR